MKCGKCGVGIDKNNDRWSLSHEVHKTIWEDPTLPEIEFLSDTCLDDYCSEEHALGALHDYLANIGAKATWADLRPVEMCTCCEADVDTLNFHHALVLTSERGEEGDPEHLTAAYAARFCTTCVPV